MKKKADIGLIGLAVMGENLVLNMAGKGFHVSVFNRTVDKVDRFIGGRGRNKNITGTHSLKELVNTLERPRKVMIMVRAGKAVDEVIHELVPLLEPGDIIIDGGNSHYTDSIRRSRQLEEKGLLFVGAGISGGEEGALHGPSIMPGGSEKAWPLIKPIFQSIAARVEGIPCCEWIGKDGAGHFVKMVHNGIEYGDMQLIAESYHMMKEMMGMQANEMHRVFMEWNRGKLNSYLIEITAAIMSYTDDDGEPLVDKILDAAGQKGTGKWTIITALDIGVPLTLITEAVYARSLSARREERVKASGILTGPEGRSPVDRDSFTTDLQQALYASKIVSYTQGFALMHDGAREYEWELDNGSIARIWRGGCIIRSAFLEKITEAYQKDPGLTNLLLAPYFRKILEDTQKGWRNVVSTALQNGVPIPAMAAALTYYDGYRAARLPANLIQAQRDYFGAHMYERTDRDKGKFFHTNWTGMGGDTSSGTYNA
ncbi:MAG: decarboxylating NADP(+)-dependent phosphogluconate dehydrogenase [Bacteroidales bacterium]